MTRVTMIGLLVLGWVLGGFLLPPLEADVARFGNLIGTNFTVNDITSPGVYVLNPTTGEPSASGGTATVDEALGDTPTGVLAVGIRDDALGTLAPVEGDAIGLRVNSTGALWVHLDDGPVLETPNGNAITDEAADAMKSLLVDASGTALAFGEDYSHDEALTITVGSSPSGPLTMGRASAAAPTSVTADNDAVPAWHLRNGAAATVLTAAGALIGGDASNGLDVDITRNAALVAGTAYIGQAGGFDPCSNQAKTFVPIDIVTATTVELANAVASEFFYICSIELVTNATNSVVIAEDDTDGCGSISAGVTGGTTAAEGWTFAANGGIATGNGASSVAKTTTANRYLCILTSANTQLSGSISFVSDP